MDDTSQILSFTFDETHEGQRMDKVLGALSADLSRARIQDLIAQGQVRLNGAVCGSASRKVKTGEQAEITVPPPEPWYPEAEDIALDCVYEDDHLIVINKQAGLVVHPGAGNKDGTLVNALLHHCGDSLSGIGGVQRPGIVHRLDKDTTGLMVVAKTDKAHRHLSAQLKDRSLSRVYHALVLGVPVPLKGAIDQPLGRDQRNRLKMTVRRRDGKPARTHYKILERYRGEFALVECTLESGRTHQIRVHMQFIAHPLIGDPAYGPQKTGVAAALKRGGFGEEACRGIEAFPRPALHAQALSFVHPDSEETLSFTASHPEDLSLLTKFLAKTDKK